MDKNQADKNMTDKNLSETFVFKLYRMVEDTSHSHLMCWNQDGTSFIVRNAMEFARDVLPKYFKHNNFSSYVRQLNMYGFHKVNETPRSARGSSENQYWEFSHAKFVRGHPELLVDIKRKVVGSNSGGSSIRSISDFDFDNVSKRDNEVAYHLSLMKNIQNDFSQQLMQFQENFHHVLKDLMETKRKQSMYYEAMKKMIDVLNKQQVLITGGAPNTKYYDLQYFGLSEFEERRSDITSPMIYISPSETNYGNIKQENEFSDYSRMDFPKLSVPSLMGQSRGMQSMQNMQNMPHLQNMQNMQNLQNVQTIPTLNVGGMQNLSVNTGEFHGRHQRSGSYTMAINTPLPPSPLNSPIGSPGYTSPLTDLTDEGEDDYMDPNSPIEEDNQWNRF